MVTEDFSFPKISNSVSQLAFSPSLWRVTSLVYPEFGDEEENGGDHGTEEALQSKSSSNLERTVHEANDRGGGGHSLDTEKMDMLWEDFNEELKLEGRVRLSSSRFKFKAEKAAASREKEEEESFRAPTTVELRYAQALQVSKASVGGAEMKIYHKRRQSISTLTLMKTFKRILFLRQTRTSTN